MLENEYLTEEINIYLYQYKNKIEAIMNGDYDYIFSINMDILKRDIADGNNYKNDLLSRINISKLDGNAEYLLKMLHHLKQLLSYKKNILVKIEEKKTRIEYHPDELAIDSWEANGRITYTYDELLFLFDQVETILNSDKIYRLLDFYLKYDHLIEELERRRKIQNMQTDSSQFLQIINKDDNHIGIIKIEETEGRKKDVKIVAGTKKDIELSNLICKPYPADIDTPGYDYGPHGDFYMPPHQIVKTFYDTDLSETHKRMIMDEQKKRDRRKKLSLFDEDGIIKGVVVSRKTLIDNGFDPQQLGWEPLEIKNKRKKKNIYKIYKDTYQGWTIKHTLDESLDVAQKIQKSRRKKL